MIDAIFGNACYGFLSGHVIAMVAHYGASLLSRHHLVVTLDVLLSLRLITSNVRLSRHYRLLWSTEW